MYRAFYAGNELLLLPVLAMFVFMTVFVIASARAWKLKDGERLKKLGGLPLEDGIETPTAGEGHE